MVRIAKDPEERKTEIVDAAEELFFEKGYDKTAVSDIVKKIGVAQGLFYYYFKCKDEIINAIAEKYLNSIVTRTRKICENTDVGAIAKIHLLIEDMFDVLGLRKKGIFKFLKHAHKEENLPMHQRIAKKMVAQLIPMVSEIVKQGIKEGSFNTQYPVEVTEVLLTWAGLLHNNVTLPIEDKENFIIKVRAIEDMVERMLGAKKGSMEFVKYVGWIIHE